MNISENQQTQHARFTQVVAQCRKQAQLFVTERLTELLDRSEEALLEFSEKATSDAIRTRLIEAAVVVTNERSQIETSFYREFQIPFIRLLNPTRRISPLADRSEQVTEPELSLVDRDEMEETVAMENLVRKVLDGCFSELYALRQRLAIVNGGRPLDKGDLPAGPDHLVNAFHVAIGALNIDLRGKLILYAMLDKFVTSQTKPLYLELNEILRDAGVLPNLKQIIRRRQHSSPGVSEERHPADSDASLNTEGRANGARPSLGDELFDSILQFMTARRTTNPQGLPASATSAPGIAGTAASTIAQLSSLVSAIGQIQVLSASSFGHASASEEGGPRPEADPLFVEKTKQALSDERARIFEHLGPQQVAPIDADIIDIVGMMFEYMLNDPLLPNVAKALISRLHTPYLKVALIDPHLRTDKAHPARRFLDLLVEAGSQYVDEADTSRGIYPEMRTLVERVLADFSDNIGLFRELLGILELAVSEQKRKTTSIEQRAQQAVKGQERLLLAKQRAAQEMAGRARQPFLPAQAVSFLSEVWVDKLVFILLRHPQGDKSSEWREAVRIADLLVRAFDPALLTADARALDRSLPQLCDDIENELRSLGGRLPEAWQTLASLLADPQSVQRHRVEYASRITPGGNPEPTRQVITSPTATGQTPPQPQPASPAQQSPRSESQAEPPITPREQQLINEFRELPFGTWVEFRGNDGSAPRRIKLSWFSPMTGTCMFVDSSGRKAETKPIRVVTAELLAGRANIIRQSKQPFFERALKSIQEMLKAADKFRPGNSKPNPTMRVTAQPV